MREREKKRLCITGKELEESDKDGTYHGLEGKSKVLYEILYMLGKYEANSSSGTPKVETGWRRGASSAALGTSWRTSWDPLAAKGSHIQVSPSTILDLDPRLQL